MAQVGKDVTYTGIVIVGVIVTGWYRVHNVTLGKMSAFSIILKIQKEINYGACENNLSYS